MGCGSSPSCSPRPLQRTHLLPARRWFLSGQACWPNRLSRLARWCRSRRSNQPRWPNLSNWPNGPNRSAQWLGFRARLRPHLRVLLWLSRCWLPSRRFGLTSHQQAAYRHVRSWCPFRMRSMPAVRMALSYGAVRTHGFGYLDSKTFSHTCLSAASGNGRSCLSVWRIAERRLTNSVADFDCVRCKRGMVAVVVCRFLHNN